MPYILDERKLKKGDIILTRNDSSTSKAIRKIANSNYSHAILYLGNHSFMEADINGVEFFSTQRYAFKEPKNISIRRLKKTKSELMNVVVANARKYSYRDYNMDGVKNLYRERMQGVKIKGVSDFDKIGEWDKPLFCSQLIGVVFKQSGIDLANVGSLDSFSPYEIENSELLEEVEDFLIEISEEVSSQYTLYGEDDLPENVLSMQTEVSQEISIKIKQDYQDNGLPIPADFQDAIDKLGNIPPEKIPVADKILSTRLKESGLLDLWKENKRLYPYLYNPFELIQKWDLDNFTKMQQAIIYIKDLRASINETISFQNANLTTSKDNYNKSSLEVFRLFSEMYENFIRDLEEAVNNIDVALIPLEQISNIITGMGSR